MNLLVALTLLAAPLPRQAALGFETDETLTVRTVTPDTPAADAGLTAGAKIAAINGERVKKPYLGHDRLRRLDGGEPLELTLEGGERLHFTPAPKPGHAVPGFEIDAGVVEVPGARLRSYVAVPEGSRGRRPTIFFVQWVSCRSIEDASTTMDMLWRVARERRMAVILVERSANGDSEGPGCHALDFDTEVEHYRRAFDVLTRHRRVDRDRVVMWGNSLGSVTSPLVAQGKRIAGLVVGGGGALTYLERMITFDRVRLERDDGDPRAIHAEMMRRIRFHTAYLLDGKDPQDIERERPELRGVWSRILGTGDGVHYGRPYAYHRQAAQKNLLAAWLEIRAPVLVMYGEYDQFEAEHGHRLIARVLNRARPGSARFVRHINMGHSTSIYPDEYAAHRWDASQRAPGDAVAARTVSQWLEDTVLRDAVRADGATSRR